MCLLLSACAHAPSRLSSISYHRADLSMRVPASYTLKNKSYVAVEVPITVFEKIKIDLEKTKNRTLKSRGEAHITLLTPPELKVLRKRLSDTEIERVIQETQVLKAPYNLLCVGQGAVKHQITYYVVVQGEAFYAFRKILQQKLLDQGGKNTDFNSELYYPHVTVGFTDRDLHLEDGVIKDASSCVYTLHGT